MSSQGYLTPPTNDFWRSDAGTVLPDGTTDTTKAIAHQGKVAVGNVQTDIPVATLDVANATRTGTDSRVATQGMLVTADFPSITTGVTPVALKGAEFLHSNQTVGIGIAHDGIYATGSNANQPLHLMQKGNAIIRMIWQNIALAVHEKWNMATIAIGNHILTKSLFGSSGINLSNHYNAFVQSVTPLQVRQQFDVTSNGSMAAAMRIAPSLGTLGATEVSVGEDQLNRRKLVLFNAAGADTDQFFGFGMESAAMRYQVQATASNHRFYAATAATTSNLLMELNGNGNVGIGTIAGAQQAKIDVRGGSAFGPSGIDTTRSASIRANTLNAFAGTPLVAAVTAGTSVLNLVREGTAGTAFASTAEFRLGRYGATGINSQSTMELWLGNGASNVADTRVMTVRGNGRINMPLMPTFTSNASAITGSLVVGDLYKTAAGAVRIVV